MLKIYIRLFVVKLQFIFILQIVFKKYLIKMLFFKKTLMLLILNATFIIKMQAVKIDKF